MQQENEIIFQTKYWIVKHRSDSRYPGYLIVLSTEPVLNISDLSEEALIEMALVLAKAEKLLIEVYSPYRVISFKMGFAKGVNCHFNLIPATFALLEKIQEQKACTYEKPDGSDVVLYVCRKYCERELTNEEYRDLLATTAILRDHWNNVR
jgi:diadenosine tetraphosphate (Ap4A) HIT family hydrolase